jgi:hypothetical protein
MRPSNASKIPCGNLAENTIQLTLMIHQHVYNNFPSVGILL